MTLPDVERVAAAVHAAWCATMRRGGASTVRSDTGEELLRAYPELSEPAKDVSRNMVRVVYVGIAVVSTEPVDLPPFEPGGAGVTASGFPEPPEMKRSYPPRNPGFPPRQP